MKNRKLLLGIVAAIVLLVIGWMVEKPKVDRTLIGQGIKAVRILQNGKATDAAEVSVPFTRKDNAYVFANVAIDLNQDGKIADYAIDGGTQQEWVVQNMRAKADPEGNTYSFTLGDRAVDGRKDLKLIAVLTKAPLKNWAGRISGDAAAAELIVASFETEDFGALIAPTNPNGSGAGATPDTRGSMGTKTNFSDAKQWLTDTTAPSGAGQGAGAGAGDAAIGAAPANGVPPAGTDFEVFQSDVPDMAQGTNECVPTSTSDALHWLGKRYGFEDKLPKDQRDTMNELKPDFHWSAADGVYVEPNYIPGKVAFSRRHNLPIVTHQIGGKLDEHMTENIAAELAKGQAVEIVIGYYKLENNIWVRHGGHMMSAVGAFGAGGKTFLGLHDPASPGTNRLDIYNVDKSRIYDYRYRGDNAVFIEYAIAESPTQEWLTAHPATTVVETSGGIVEARDLQDVWFIDVLKIGNNYYPVKQFHTFTGPECDKAEHWHANIGTAWGLDLGQPANAPFKFTPAEVKARHAKLVEWTDPESCGAGKTAVVPRLQLMISKDESNDLISKIVR